MNSLSIPSVVSISKPQNPTTSASIRRPVTSAPSESAKIPNNLLSVKLVSKNPLKTPLPPRPQIEPELTFDFIQKEKIFVGNLPLWIKKPEIVDFFKQFGPIKNVILIKGHKDVERNVGYCFVIFGGPDGKEAAKEAVEVDGVEFHGRKITVGLDNGGSLKEKTEEREKWMRGEVDRRVYRSRWHEERDKARKWFKEVADRRTENWNVVVNAFEKIAKPSRKEFGLMISYYARRGDKHHARATFEKMRARGIEPNSYVFTNLIHAYAIARDMRGALSCIDDMVNEGIELTLVTYSVLIAGYANTNDPESADNLFKEAKQKLTALNPIIYSNIIYAHCQNGNMDRAEELVKQMEEEGIDVPIDLYHTMMDGYTNIGNEVKCLIVFQRLKECGFNPSIISYGCLINLHTKMDKAIEVIDMMVLASIAPNEHTYTIVMEGYASIGDIGKAFEYFTKIKEGGLKLDVFTYESLLKACCKACRMQSALAIIKEMSIQKIHRSTCVYNILIDGWARRGDMLEADDLIQQMKEDGVAPDIRTYTSFVNACCKAGDMLRASGWASKSLPEKALACFEAMKSSGLVPDEAAYHCLMTSLLSRATVAEEYIYTRILDVCKEMVEHELTFDMKTAAHWAKCLRKIERSGGELTEVMQRTFPPVWNSRGASEDILNKVKSNSVNREW